MLKHKPKLKPNANRLKKKMKGKKLNASNNWKLRTMHASLEKKKHALQKKKKKRASQN